ncbi:MAG: hypothetical protein AB1405_02015 [Bdellovibrionota bacterium]
MRLKMCIESVNRRADQDGQISAEEISARAVYGQEGSVNAQWSKWTPAGHLQFTVSNPEAFGKILPGQFYFVDLVPTDKDGI